MPRVRLEVDDQQYLVVDGVRCVSLEVRPATCEGCYFYRPNEYDTTCSVVDNDDAECSKGQRRDNKNIIWIKCG